jgi:hypothetical protein
MKERCKVKKLVTVLAMSFTLFAGVGNAFAQVEDEVFQNESVVEELESKVSKYDVLKEFTDELHQIDQLRIEKHGLQAQIIAKKDTILDLYIAARENGNKGALQAAREQHKQLSIIRQEIKELRELTVVEIKAFKEMVKAENKEAATQHIQSVITLQSAINGKIEQKNNVLNQVIDLLN